MTVTKPATPVSKPMSLKEKQVYWKQPENQQKAIDQLRQNEPAMRQLLIAVNNTPKEGSR
jgi:hypothetical protein